MYHFQEKTANINEGNEINLEDLIGSEKQNEQVSRNLEKKEFFTSLRVLRAKSKQYTNSTRDLNIEKQEQTRMFQQSLHILIIFPQSQEISLEFLNLTIRSLSLINFFQNFKYILLM